MRRLILSALTLCLASLSVLSAASGATTPPPFATSEFSTSVVAENNLPGTTAWHLGATPKGTYVEGFFNKDYVAAGDATSFYVSTNATTYRLAAYRMGWYHGAGGRLVWTSPVESGRVQPACPLNATVNMVSCTNWSAGGSVAITSDFVPGDYVFKLTASNGAQSYMLLTVWNPTSTATYVLIGRTMTDEGWNTFGGYDFYRGVGTCAKGAASYPPCNRARVVSLDRPYATGHGSSDFFGNEYPLVSFVEEHGLDVTYVTDVTLNDHPAFALHHKAILSLGHDETWSYPERAGVLQAFHQGTNLVFFGSAAVLRHARMQASAFGPSREVVDYRDSYADPLLGHGNPMDVTGNTFAQYPTGLPPTQLTGELYSGYTVRGHFFPYVVADAGSWLYDGLSVKDGTTIPGVVTSDFDHVAYAAGTPHNFQVLGHSPIPAGVVTTGQGVWHGFTYSDAGYFTSPASFAGSFNAGTVNWISTITQCNKAACPAPLMSVMTSNLLRVFGAGPVGKTFPSKNSFRLISPPGS